MSSAHATPASRSPAAEPLNRIAHAGTRALAQVGTGRVNGACSSIAARFRINSREGRRLPAFANRMWTRHSRRAQQLRTKISSHRTYTVSIQVLSVTDVFAAMLGMCRAKSRKRDNSLIAMQKRVANDLLPNLPSFIRRVCSSFAPGWGVLRTQLA
jgi:hypothetical protein